MAMWELAPGSPWNATFSFLVMVPCISRSRFGKDLARGFEVGGGIDPARHGIDDGDVDPNSCLQGPELFELFLPFQRRRRHADKTLQRRAAIGIEADMVIPRPLAVDRPGARKLQRAPPSSGVSVANATRPIFASSARRSTWTIIGTPAISSSGFPGRRVEAMRAGISTRLRGSVIREPAESVRD